MLKSIAKFKYLNTYYKIKQGNYQNGNIALVLFKDGNDYEPECNISVNIFKLNPNLFVVDAKLDLKMLQLLCELGVFEDTTERIRYGYYHGNPILKLSSELIDFPDYAPEVNFN